MKINISVSFLYVLFLALISTSINAKVPYVADIIEPVTDCAYLNGIAMYAGLPSNPYYPTIIDGRLHPTSQYYNSLPLLPGLPQGSFSIKSRCDPASGRLLMGVCGAPIGYTGYGGVISVNPNSALPNYPSRCIPFGSGDFISYTFGAPNITGAIDDELVINVTPSSISTSVIGIWTFMPTDALFLVGPIPSNTIVGGIPCYQTTPCSFSTIIQTPVSGNIDIYHLYYSDTSVQNLQVFPLQVT